MRTEVGEESRSLRKTEKKYRRVGDREKTTTEEGNSGASRKQPLFFRSGLTRLGETENQGDPEVPRGK